LSNVVDLLWQVEAASKSAVRPYRRPTAQEICYQRLQMAQQQAAQLAPAVKTLAVKTPGVKTPGVKTPGVKASSASSPSSSFAGERKRIAHRPNPFAPFPSKPGTNTSTFVCFVVLEENPSVAIG